VNVHLLRAKSRFFGAYEGGGVLGNGTLNNEGGFECVTVTCAVSRGSAWGKSRRVGSPFIWDAKKASHWEETAGTINDNCTQSGSYQAREKGPSECEKKRKCPYINRMGAKEEGTSISRYLSHVSRLRRRKTTGSAAENKAIASKKGM